MRRCKQCFRFAAFIPAIVLVGAFIGCRAGAFDLFSKPEPKPEPHPLSLNAPNPPAEPPAPDKKTTFMPGAKSMAINPEVWNKLNQEGKADPAPVEKPPAQDKPPVFFGGAKSPNFPVIPPKP